MKFGGLILLVATLVLMLNCAAPTSAPSPEETPTPPPTPTLTPTLPTGVTPPELVRVADLPGGDIKDIVFAPSDPNVVYLASDTNAMGVWRSDNAGETWRQVSAQYAFPVISGPPLGRTPVHTQSIAVHPDNPDMVLVGDVHGLIKMVMVGGGGVGKNAYPAEVRPGLMHTITAVAFSPSMPNLAYGADENGEILKSTDSGDTWQAVSRVDSIPHSLAVDPHSPHTLYVGTATGVSKSTNGGRDWQQMLTVGEVFSLSITAGAPDSVFAATSEGVFKSSDGGATWRRTLELKTHSVEVAPSDARVVYAGTPEGVFKSGDGGETWRPHATGMEYLNVGPLAVHPRDPNTVIAGSNINLWTRYGGPFPASTEGEGIYKTTDGGLSWVRKGKGEFIDVDVIEVAVNPNNPNVVYAGTRASRGMYRSEDGGDSWTILPKSPGEIAHYPWGIAHYTMRIATVGDSILWLTGASGMTWSPDRGQTWEQPLDMQSRHFHGIGISPHDPWSIFVGTVARDPIGTTYYPGARILHSPDGGSWQEVGAGFPSGADTAIEDFAFDPFNTSVVYVATSSHHRLVPEPLSITLGIYKSADGGQTWTPANTGLADKNVHSIVASPAQAGLLYAGTTTGVFRSTDGSTTWTHIGLSNHVHRLLVDPAEPDSLYAGTDSGLFWSFNGGDTWQRLDSVPAKPIISLTMDARGRVLYVAVNTVGVFKSVKP